MFDLNNPETLIAIEIRNSIDKFKVSEVIELLWHENKNNYQLIKSDSFYGLIYDKNYKEFVDNYIENNYK